MAEVFRRAQLAAELARRLLRPGVLDEGLRSGLFLSGPRRIGKTTFLRSDLVPELEARGAVVIYVDLWSDIKASPAALVHGAVRRTLAELESPRSPLLERWRRIKGLDLGAAGFRFGFQLAQLGEDGGATLAEAFTELVDQACADLVLIVDEVQQAITTEEGNQMLLALKAARDAINTRPDTPGHFLFVGTGSHRALVSELTARRNQAFAGATSLPYPVLDEAYVAHVLQRASPPAIRGSTSLKPPMAAPIRPTRAAADAFPCRSPQQRLATHSGHPGTPPSRCGGGSSAGGGSPSSSARTLAGPAAPAPGTSRAGSIAASGVSTKARSRRRGWGRLRPG